MSVATQVNYHCPFYGRKCYECGYWNSRANDCEIITHQDRKILYLTHSGKKSSNMKAKELGRILLAMGDISVVFASSCNDKQIQLQDVKGIKLENNIVTLI